MFPVVGVSVLEFLRRRLPNRLYRDIEGQGDPRVGMIAVEGYRGFIGREDGEDLVPLIGLSFNLHSRLQRLIFREMVPGDTDYQFLVTLAETFIYRYRKLQMVPGGFPLQGGLEYVQQLSVTMEVGELVVAAAFLQNGPLAVAQGIVNCYHVVLRYCHIRSLSIRESTGESAATKGGGFGGRRAVEGGALAAWFRLLYSGGAVGEPACDPIHAKEVSVARISVPEADAILDTPFPVLNKGFVRLVDYLGGDQRIVQAARVSYGAGTKSYRQDKGLITYLLRNDHTSPFEQVVLTFHLKMPIFVARQWIRHRTARLNEISGRYSVMKDEFYLPALEDVAGQSEDNKQGRTIKPLPEAEAAEVTRILSEGQQRAYREYEGLLESGVARELARVNLPLSLYTEWYWQMDLHNLFHFLKLRLDPHAQREIRLYAEVVMQAVEKVAPIACEAFRTHIRGSARFSSRELEALRRMSRGEEHGLEGREGELFLAKLNTGTD